MRSFIIYDYCSSCEGRCNHNDIETCRCDADCLIFGDCCFDYDVMCSSSLPIQSESWINPTLYGCYGFDLHSVLLVDKCPSTWKEPNIKSLCTSNVNDMIVFDRHGYNFRNVFCAVCNYRKINHVYPWNMIPYDSRSCHDTSMFNGSTFMNMKNDMGLEFIIGIRLRLFYQGSRCPPATSPILVEKCSASALVYQHPQCKDSFMNDYKNHYCYFCINGYIPRCRGFGYKSMWQFGGQTQKAVLQHVEPCLSNEIRDPVAQSCRQISCRPGYRLSMKSNTCVLNKDANSIIINKWHCLNMHSIFFFKRLIKEHDVTKCIKETFGRYGRFVNREYKIPSHDNMEWRAFEMKDGENMFDVLRFLDRSLLHDSNEFSMNQAELFCGVTDMEVVLTCDKRQFSELLINCTGDWYSGSPSDFVVVNNVSDMSSILYVPNGIYITPVFIIYHTRYYLEYRQVQKKDIMFICGDMTHSTRLDCSFVLLNSSEYMLKENETLLVNGDEEFRSGDFLVLPNKQAQVCFVHFPDKTFDFDDDDDFTKQLTVSPLGIFSFVTTSMSMFGSLGTLISYVKFKSLRNIYGIVIMSLSVALFMAQLLNILNESVDFEDGICVAVGVIKHYFWLATFTWTSIGACVLFVQFAMEGIHSHSAVSKSPKRVVALQFVGWGIPLSLESVLSALHFLTSSSSLEGMLYSGETCWLVAGLASLLAFGIPVGISLSVNIVLIAITLVKLHKARMRSIRLQNKQGKKNKWTEVMMFAKVIFSAIVIRPLQQKWISSFLQQRSVRALPRFMYRLSIASMLFII